jgi:phytoene dehydrogenase-like protein
LEATDRVGGRVATDEVEGFLLDRGFQVFLDRYPDARAELDIDALDLRGFYPGSLVRYGRRTYRIADPWRDPVAGVRSLFTPIFSVTDAPAMAAVRLGTLRSSSDPTAWAHGSETAGAYLERRMSTGALDRFLRPFFGGVFLDRSLAVPRPYFEFIFAMFARGRATLPSGGMGAIPTQLADGLPPGTVQCGRTVTGVEDGHVVQADGERVPATHVIVATDGSTAGELAGMRGTTWSGCITLYFAAPTAPYEEPILTLNGDGPSAGPVNHVCIPSNVAPAYAPGGQALISATVVGIPDDTLTDLEADARSQLHEWFGDAVRTWRFLRAYRIDRALPRMEPLPLAPPTMAAVGGCRLIVAGDHVESPSINGAIASGARAARTVIDDLG